MESAARLEDIFSGFLLEAVRTGRPDDQTQNEADFIQDLLQLAPSAKVLDVPCGGGRLSLELARRGYQVTGIDIAAALLEDARHKAAERQLTVAFEHRDMRDIPWQGEFDGIFCFWESLGYFDDDGNRAFLEAVFRALKPGGRFLVDTHTAETLLPRLGARDWARVNENMLILEERQFDHEKSRLERQWVFVQDGKVEQRQLSMRIYTYHELTELLKEVGFASYEGYGLLNKKPFMFGMSRLNMVAVKGNG